MGRDNATLDPTAPAGEMRGLNVKLDTEIKSIIEVMRNRELVERVIEQIGFESHVTSESGREKAITSLMEEIHVWSPRQTTVIGIEAKARSPERARDVVKTLVEVYLDEHVHLNQTPHAYEFIDQRTKLLRDELGTASQALRDAKSEFRVASIEGRRDALQTQTTAVEAQLFETTSAMAASLAKIETQRASMKLLSGQTSKPIGGQSVAASAMRQKLHELQTQEQALLAKYSRRHPAVIVIRGRVQESQQRLLAEQSDRRQAMTGALLRDESTYRSLQAREKALREERFRLHDKLSVLNQQALKVRELERRVQVVETNYLT
ncbi:MAG: GumC family protein, partial [Pirellulales bacterium]